MVYSTISLYISENTKRRNMGKFYGIFWELPQNVQALIIGKLHGNMKTWCIQHKSLIMDTLELAKYR